VAAHGRETARAARPSARARKGEQAAHKASCGAGGGSGGGGARARQGRQPRGYALDFAGAAAALREKRRANGAALAVARPSIVRDKTITHARRVGSYAGRLRYI
jgi:hypothetical protein